MNCRRAEELFSDAREGELTPVLERELSGHLEACAACAELFRAFEDVTSALGKLTVPAPPPVLTDALVALAPPAAPHRRRVALSSPRRVAAASWLAVAASLALLMVFRPPELTTDLSYRTTRAARQLYGFAVGSYHDAELWFEDLNVLRMTVVVAFEDRIEEINDQLRELADARRRPRDRDNEQSKDRRRSGSRPTAALSVHSSRSVS